MYVRFATRRFRIVVVLKSICVFIHKKNRMFVTFVIVHSLDVVTSESYVYLCLLISTKNRMFVTFVAKDSVNAVLKIEICLLKMLRISFIQTLSN
ncbi:UNVERIFIED_CONTAM: hypothetical protein NCL1_48004 [Trichonephila clavipes]